MRNVQRERVVLYALVCHLFGTMVGLIINGDDFGISSATNRAIVRAHEKGILTSASLMVNGPAFAEAVELAKAHRKLSVGIHLVLVQGKATLPPAEIPNLVDAQGAFRKNPVGAGMAYFFFPSFARQIRKELEAQMRKFLSTGIPLDHVNGHLHIHVHPNVLHIVIDLAGRYGVKKIRLPQEELFKTLRVDPRRWYLKLTQWTIFRLLSTYARRHLQNAGFGMPDRAYGLLQSGQMNESYLLGLLDRLGNGCYEISFHLGEAADWPRYYDGDEELAALLSTRVRARIANSGRKLISYAEL